MVISSINSSYRTYKYTYMTRGSLLGLSQTLNPETLNPKQTLAVSFRAGAILPAIPSLDIGADSGRVQSLLGFLGFKV